MFPVSVQSIAGETGRQEVGVKILWVMPDRGYSFDRVRLDASLVREKDDSLRVTKAGRFWLKLEAVNRGLYAQAYRVKVYPFLHNTIFYYAENTSSWTSQQVGITASSDLYVSKGEMPLIIQGRSTCIFYVLVKVDLGNALPKVVHARATMEEENAAEEREGFLFTAWAVSMAVLLILTLNNLHLYYRFRDSAILAFLITQVGGMLYITAFRFIFNVIFPGIVFSSEVLADGTCSFYNMNNLFMHLSVVMIMYGSTQMTRAFLNTKKNLPKLDKWLLWSMKGYMGFSAGVALVNVSGFYIERYTILFDNLLVLALAGLLLFTGIVAFRARLPFSKSFLFAHVPPLVFILSVAFYHVFVSFTNGRLLLPDLAIVSQALCFSAAVVTRIQALRKDLLDKEMEMDELALDIRKQEIRQRETLREKNNIQAALQQMDVQRERKEMEIRQLSSEMQEKQSANKELLEQLDAKRRELASSTLYMEQKNAMLAQLKQQIKDLDKNSPNVEPKELAGIKSLLNANLHLDDDWLKFKLHFEQVHPYFFQDLQARYPALTKNEQRLYSYFHINLSTKEIAALLNIDPASVRRAKTRLLKKMAATDNGLAPDAPDETEATQ
ncbi:7TM diverse intracellular signaling domain-containing protein [Rufibacter sp. LB8]|uniref:7TM diverse intracellular signaling domain-containing protein n=1 Tax=Rufibacter sp. LB8 TaxID=2777781 RepID=UPI00178C70A3|nr:7TM diverse intracellular signaling domain-containing protein [Rufibacter sp. LB8]